MRSEAQSLLGRYRLGEVIGAGGMGTVLQAHDEVLGRSVAVKLLREELAADERSLVRFRQEARIAASLSHPGIAAVYDFAEEGGRPAIVMELLDGQDLHTVLSVEGPMDPARAAAIVAQAADALSYAHGMGAVHRDVKPANIFLTRSGAVKITDFGVAYAAGGGQLTTTGALIGTPDYLSPEQVRGERATAASDVYSLGCVAFELLTGRPPFGGDNSIAVATSRLGAPPPSARALHAEVGEELDEVVRRALAPAPGDRYPTAAAMARALRAAVRHPAPTPPVGPLAGGPATERLDSGPATLVEPPLPARVPRPPPGRSRKWAGLWAALLVLFMAGLTLDVVRAWQRQNAPRAVPSWTGVSFQQASGQARRLGFVVKRVDAPHQPPAEVVLGSTPAAGTRLKPGSTVTLAVSLGNLFALPDVRTKNVDDATTILRGQHLNVIRNSQTVPGAVDGLVDSQDPAPGALVSGGAPVTLTVTAVPPGDQSPPGDQGGDNGFLAPLLNPLLNLFGTPTPPGHGRHGGGG